MSRDDTAGMLGDLIQSLVFVLLLILGVVRTIRCNDWLDLASAIALIATGLILGMERR